MSDFTQLHIIREQTSYGPYSAEQLFELVQQGQVLATDAISDGYRQWDDFHAFHAAWNAAAATPPSPSARPATAAVRYSQEDLSKADSKVRSSYLLILFIVAIPALLWASANDKQRGVQVNPNQRRAATKQMLQNNSGLFGPSCVVAGIALVPAIMLMRKRRQALQQIRQNLQG